VLAHLDECVLYVIVGLDSVAVEDVVCSVSSNFLGNRFGNTRFGQVASSTSAKVVSNQAVVLAGLSVVFLVPGGRRSHSRCCESFGSRIRGP